MDKECSCQEWQDSAKQIDAAQIFCALQVAGPKYTGALFEFCPWCGLRLLTSEAPDVVGKTWICKECGAENMDCLKDCGCCEVLGGRDRD